MKPVHVVLAAFAVILVIAVHSSEAITCYVCNTREDMGGEACFDPDNADDKTKKEFSVDCGPQGVKKDANYTLCRKIRQDVNGEVRVVRTCATGKAPGPEGRCVERTGTTKIYMTYCECEGDLCNSAPVSVTVSTLALVISAVIGLKLSS